MEIRSQTEYSGTDNSIYAHTLSEFVEAGKNKVAPLYGDWCYVDSYNNINFTVKNVLDDYLFELKKLATNVYLEDKDISKYNYKPKLLSADIYGTTELDYIILLLNGICNVKEFHDINPIKLIRKDDLLSYLSNINTSEKYSIDIYNNSK